MQSNILLLMCLIAVALQLVGVFCAPSWTYGHETNASLSYREHHSSLTNLHRRGDRGSGSPRPRKRPQQNPNLSKEASPCGRSRPPSQDRLGSPEAPGRNQCQSTVPPNPWLWEQPESSQKKSRSERTRAQKDKANEQARIRYAKRKAAGTLPARYPMGERKKPKQEQDPAEVGPKAIPRRQREEAAAGARRPRETTPSPESQEPVSQNHGALYNPRLRISESPPSGLQRQPSVGQRGDPNPPFRLSSSPSPPKRLREAVRQIEQGRYNHADSDLWVKLQLGQIYGFPAIPLPVRGSPERAHGTSEQVHRGSPSQLSPGKRLDRIQWGPDRSHRDSPNVFPSRRSPKRIQETDDRTYRGPPIMFPPRRSPERAPEPGDRTYRGPPIIFPPRESPERIQPTDDRIYCGPPIVFPHRESPEKIHSSDNRIRQSHDPSLSTYRNKGESGGTGLPIYHGPPINFPSGGTAEKAQASNKDIQDQFKEWRDSPTLWD